MKHTEITTPEKKTVYRVSNWISIQSAYITPRSDLWYYAEHDEGGKHGFVDYFRFNGHRYAVNQFISRWSAWGGGCETLPDFICGYDGDGDIYNPLLLELNDEGNAVRLYLD